MSKPKPEATPNTLTIGVDIGGTFTDFVVADGGRLVVHKEPSTPHDPSEAFLRGLAALDLRPPARIVHGSTVATNAVLERRGARAALLTTAGFRDVLEIGRQTRRELYSFTPTKATPLIPRERCFEVPERVDKHGCVIEPMDEVALAGVLDAIIASGAESLAVVFLFSFANPEHERRAEVLAASRGLQVSLSSDVLPEYREYERASTTAANAYVAPLMDRYLSRLEERLAEWADGASWGRLQIMQSNGGIISPRTARAQAVRTVLSGPAGGVVGASRIARDAGFARIITFDMGGTSTDVALVDGVPTTSTEGAISDLPIRVPMLDIHTVGAGGGSIARVDPAGGLRVGPESAGADPGPAAYGCGTVATVTDANVALGRFALSQRLGDLLTLDADRAREAVTAVAEALGLSCEAMAAGIVRVANVQMAGAIRRVSVERGHDPRVCCLVAFGGGGPLHACDLADETGIPTVLIPRYPGALSALGMLLTGIQKDYSRTVMHRSADNPERLDTEFADLERTAAADLHAEGVAEPDITLSRLADVRYQGQSYELTIPAAATEAGDTDVAALQSAFHAAHRLRYGHAADDAPVEIVNVRLQATGAVPQPTLPSALEKGGVAPVPRGSQPVFVDGGWSQAAVHARPELLPGHRFVGPALITQADSTCWIPPGWIVRIDGWYNVVASRS